MISLNKICDYYFDSFSWKNIDRVSELLSDDVELIDWNVKSKGKYQVIEEYKNIFNNVNTIRAYVNKYYEYGDTVCCDITIIIDDKEKIEVMDVITFDDMAKIKKIKAYKI